MKKERRAHERFALEVFCFSYNYRAEIINRAVIVIASNYATITRCLLIFFEGGGDERTRVTPYMALTAILIVITP